MPGNLLVKVIFFTSVLTISGCATKITQPSQYSGFLKDYSGLRQTTSASGKSELRWVAPGYAPSNYDNIVYTPIIYYPAPKPTKQITQDSLNQLLAYTNQHVKQAIAQKKPLATTPGPRSLIFRGAITAVDSSKEGLQFYEVLPIALVVAGTEVATGHRTMETNLFFEGELIDASTNKPVIKVVRKGEGKNLSNESKPLTIDTLKQVIDDMAVDAVKFDPQQQ